MVRLIPTLPLLHIHDTKLPQIDWITKRVDVTQEEKGFLEYCPLAAGVIHIKEN
jgi:hypothetical protein